MTNSQTFRKAQDLLTQAKNITFSQEDLSKNSIQLASLLLQESIATETRAEKAIFAELSRMMEDPSGRAFTTDLTDQCFRSRDPKRAADQILYLLHKYGIPHFLSTKKKLQLWFFKKLGRLFPQILIPLTKRMLRQEASRVIIPDTQSQLITHIITRRNEGVRTNLNHLGEAILGENEARDRLHRYLEDLKNPYIDCVSIKISTICSQIDLLGWDNTLHIIVERLQTLYRVAQQNQYIRPDGTSVAKFVYLDMEEYRDLHLTVQAFVHALEDPEFLNYSAGIVLQAYIPESFSVQQELTEWAQMRLNRGGAPIKIRLVKGANLAMELVEASLKGWPQAPYLTKLETDANFLRMVNFGSQPQRIAAAHLAIASHNLFDIAYALLIRSQNNIENELSFEMLEGMADHIRRVVQKLSGSMLLYCPTASEEEFQNAMGYLIRRLDENTAPENFLRYLFKLTPDSREWQQQQEKFQHALLNIDKIQSVPRRNQNRNFKPEKPSPEGSFENEPDTDWSLAQNRQWAESIIQSWGNRKFDCIPLTIGEERVVSPNLANGEDPSNPGEALYQYSLASQAQIDQALDVAKEAEEDWAQTPLAKRSKLLADIAQVIREYRGDLIGAMVADTGKTIHEADVEVSEAIDFAEYYRRNADEMLPLLQDIRWSPLGTVLVAPPWNFPCSIPAGGILAALISGNCVIFKPAPEAVLVGWTLVKLFWEAGVPSKVLQFITCEDEPSGSYLVKDERINGVVLTGATATAKMFLKMRPGLPLFAETGGKNAMIITRLADRDLAVKDLVQSAFGHAGQKCSACSLVICEAEVYDDPQFRKQLLDAAASWKVGSQWDMSTRVNPLIHAPNATLLKGLTHLEPGEEWLLEPKQDPNNSNLWSPGIKLGVTRQSFTYLNELFGPVLGVMRAENVEEAITIANGTPYGLTAGLHSLDEREHKLWIDTVEAGNCYINRGMTGAIVQRQPFGGCKESGFGPGAKAGGPNYILQLMRPRQLTIPHVPIVLEIPAIVQQVGSLLEEKQKTLWIASVQSYLFEWNHHFKQTHDNSHVRGQDNIFMYKPHYSNVLRVLPDDDMLDVLRAIACTLICGASLEISGERMHVMSELSTADWLSQCPGIKIVKETEKRFLERLNLNKTKFPRIRFLSVPPKDLQIALANSGVNVIIAPQLANGRVELLHYMREVSLSADYHRYGFIKTSR